MLQSDIGKRSDIIVVDKKEDKGLQTDFAVPSRVNSKEKKT